MNHSERIEFVLGCVVIIITLAIGWKIYSVRTYINNFGSTKKVVAKFASVEGIDIGTKVKISGVKVGSVATIYIDKETFRAVVEMEIDNEINLPQDTIAQISSEGILGGKFVNISPGSDDVCIEDGGAIQITQSSVNFEDLLNKFISK